jgi:hypothetical protein
MTIYRNIARYEQRLLPLLQRFSSVEHLTLMFAIGVAGIGPDHFIDGSDLERDIIAYMPRLRQFDFHIRSILENASHIEPDIVDGRQEPILNSARANRILKQNSEQIFIM